MPSTAFRLMSSRLITCSFAALLACGGGDGGGDGNPSSADAGGGDGGGGAGVDAGGDGFAELITGSWTKGPGSDSYWCSYLNIEEDIYLTGFEALAPEGTHHTVLSVASDYDGPNKEEACGVNTVADQLVYASGVGTDPYSLPEGVALKVSAGQTLMLQLHLFNVGDTEISGTSGTRVTTARAEDVDNLAEFVFAGTFQFAIPGDGQDYTASGSCTMPSDGTVFTLWPHMHQVGKHITVSHQASVLLDTDYSFSEQKMYPIAPLQVSAGDTIDVTCTWNNPQGNATKTFGDRSTDEMCFGGIYRFPAVGSNSFCFN